MCMYSGMIEDTKITKQQLKHFSKGIGHSIEKYAIDGPLKFSRYIFTRREGKHQYGYCTHCKKEFKTTGLRHNKKTICPHCKSECTVKASGMGRKYMVDEAYFVYYEKSLVDPNIIVARGFFVERDYRNDYHKVKNNYITEALYIFEMGGKSQMFYQYYYNSDYSKTGDIYSLYPRYSPSKSISINCSYDSIEKSVKNTPFQYSTWETYKDGGDMVKFFNLYSKYPCIEYLTKEGFPIIVQTKLYGKGTYGAINWRANSIFKVLRLNKSDFSKYKNCEYKDSTLFLRLYQLSLKDKSNLSLDEIYKFQYNGGVYFKELISIHKYVSLRKIINYINKQMKKYKKDFGKTILIEWKDYISSCKILDMDLKDKNVLFPKDIHIAHQNAIKQIKIKENKAYDSMIQNRLAKLENKYVFQYNGYLIRPAASTAELIEEGNTLDHCVATHYTVPYANGSTVILFVRKVSDLQKPFCTVEFKNNTVMQAYIKHDRRPDKETLAFLEIFKKQKLQQSKHKKKIA